MLGPYLHRSHSEPTLPILPKTRKRSGAGRATRKKASTRRRRPLELREIGCGVFDPSTPRRTQTFCGDRQFSISTTGLARSCLLSPRCGRGATREGFEKMIVPGGLPLPCSGVAEKLRLTYLSTSKMSGPEAPREAQPPCRPDRRRPAPLPSLPGRRAPGRPREARRSSSFRVVALLLCPGTRVLTFCVLMYLHAEIHFSLAQDRVSPRDHDSRHTGFRLTLRGSAKACAPPINSLPSLRLN